MHRSSYVTSGLLIATAAAVLVLEEGPVNWLAEMTLVVLCVCVGVAAARNHRQLVAERRAQLATAARVAELDARLATAFTASPIPMIIVRSDDARLVEANDAFLRMHRSVASDVVGKTAAEVALLGQLVDHPQLGAAVLHGRPVRDLELKLAVHTGELRTASVAAVPIQIAGVLHVLATFVDVTDQRALEAHLQQTQKLDSIGMLAGGVAHDFNNILAVIAANAGLLDDEVTTDGQQELVAEIHAAVARATSLVRQLLAFSRKQLVNPVVLDLNIIVEDTRKMLRRVLGEDIALHTSFDPELPNVWCDPGQLAQVLMNLAVNARDAMPTGGTLTLATRRAAGECVLAVADTGCGMAPEVIARAFEPFFTTKAVGRGTGLGLSVVHGIVQQAGGRIEIASTVGTGTTFTIRFPAVHAPAELAQQVATVTAAGKEKILVVDDDAFVRAAASRALRARGYMVVEADCGPAALAALGDTGNGIALLVTDVIMPGMNGHELAQRAREQVGARLRVLYMSGYTDDIVLARGVRGEEAAFLEKPFRVDDLAAKVRGVLDRVSSPRLSS